MSSEHHSFHIVQPDRGKLFSWDQGTLYSTKCALAGILFFHMLGDDTTYAAGSCAPRYLPFGSGGFHRRGVHHACASATRVYFKRGGPLKYTLSATHTSSIQRRDFFAFGSRVGDDRHTVPSPPAALHHGAGSELWDITRLFIGPASVHRLFRCATHV